MKIKYDQPKTILNSYKSVLGQRPLWDWRHSRFYWIDVHEKILIENDSLFEKEKHALLFKEGLRKPESMYLHLAYIYFFLKNSLVKIFSR